MSTTSSLIQATKLETPFSAKNFSQKPASKNLRHLFAVPDSLENREQTISSTPLVLTCKPVLPRALRKHALASVTPLFPTDETVSSPSLARGESVTVLPASWGAKLWGVIRKGVFALVVITVFMLGIFLLANSGETGIDENTNFVGYVANADQSLRELATINNVAPSKMEDYLAQVVSANGLRNNQVFAGQYLLLPVL